jgi:flagellin
MNLGISYAATGNGGSSTVSLNSTTGAQSALGRLDAALSSMNAARSTLGAQQNRLESAIRNLTNYTENLSAAKSRIVDADFAHETAALAKFQILQQSGVAVLGQANAISQAALRLLG